MSEQLARINHSASVDALSGLSDDKQTIAVFPDYDEPTVCIYTDAGPMTLSPETALELSATLILAADIAASKEVL